MITADSLKGLLARTFSESVDVHLAPAGLLVRSPFIDNSGDELSFLIRETGDGFQLEDDGSYLSHLVASGVDIEKGQRRQMLEGVLGASGAFWDPETYGIKATATSDVASASIMFMSALLRIRDLEMLTKDVVRSTFKEDAVEAIENVLGEAFTVERNAAVGGELSENPADVVISPRGDGRRVGVFLVNNTTSFVEAELLHSYIETSGLQQHYAAAALIEDTDKLTAIGMRRFQRGVNRGLKTPIFRGDETAAMNSLSRIARAA